MASSKARKRRKRRPRSAVGGAARGERDARPAPAARPVGAPADGPPPAPWGGFPLVELCVLAGIVLLVVGFVLGGSRGAVMIAAGLALGSIGGLDVSIREHFAGYRSHTLVLAGVPALIVLGLLFYLAPAGLPQLARLAIAVAVFAAAAVLLMRTFSSRSGGDRLRIAPRGRRRRRR